MSRIVTVGAAQLGPIARSETRPRVVQRLIALMRQAKAAGEEKPTESEPAEIDRHR